MTTKESNQRLVNEAYAHLKKTKKKSMINGDCSYQGSGCAFSPAMIYPESIAGTALASKFVDLNPKVLHPWARSCDPFFANSVQRCHDLCLNEVGNEFFKEFCLRLANLCKDYNLVMPKE